MLKNFSRLSDFEVYKSFAKICGYGPATHQNGQKFHQRILFWSSLDHPKLILILLLVLHGFALVNQGKESISKSKVTKASNLIHRPPNIVRSNSIGKQSSSHAHSHKAVKYEKECGFKCSDPAETCVSDHHLCDNYVNCPNSADELNCTCKERVGIKRHCDGLADCWPLTLGNNYISPDEDGCGECSANEFSCAEGLEVPTKIDCIPLDKVCDGISQCGNHKDEKDCFKLTTFTKKKIRGILPEGILQKRVGGKWYTVCRGTVKVTTIEKYASKICDSIVGETDGSISPTFEEVSWPSSYSKPMDFILPGEQDAKFSIVSTSHCPSNKVIKITCRDPECGWPAISKHGKSKRLTPRVKRHENIEGSKPLTAKIVGGSDSDYGSWPFLVGIFRNGVFHCGGSIIDKEWVLSAAHCFHGYENHVYEVQAGMTRRFSWSPNEQTRQVSRVFVHEKYDSSLFTNDLALVKLSSKLFLSKWVRTACLSPSGGYLDPVIGQQCSVIGWGDLSETKRGPDHMQEVQLPVVKCNEAFTNEKLQICAGVAEGGKDACQGDSGGPYTCEDDNGRHILTGLVSFGRGCARPNQPGVYVRISAYNGWIDSVVSGQNQLVMKSLPPQECGSRKCLRSGGECLFDNLICNRRVDCLEAEDELNCEYTDELKDEVEISERAYSEVEKAPHQNQEHVHNIENSKICGPTEFQCKFSKTCIPANLRCSGEKECSDRTDEMGCSCESIIENAYPEKRCDGIPDCELGKDEHDCIYSNGGQDEVKCPFSNKFIRSSQWCDGMKHCSDAEDEIDCMRIVRSKTKPVNEGFLGDKLSRGLQSGYIFIRQMGTEWEPACEEEHGNDMSELVCPYLGNQLSGASPRSWTRDKRSSRYYTPRVLPVARSQSNDDLHKPHPSFISQTNQKNCTIVRTSCGDSNCGERKLYSLAGRNPAPNEVGAQPWFMVLFVEGVPACGVTLIHKEWVIAHKSCINKMVQSLMMDYVIVLSGFTEKTVKLYSPLEQIKRVNSMEEWEGQPFVLLHLESPFMSDHFAGPICTNLGYELEAKDLVRGQCVRTSFSDGRITHGFVEMSPEHSELRGHFAIKINAEDCERSNMENSFVYCSTDMSTWYYLGQIDGTDLDRPSCKTNGYIKLVNPFYGVLEEKVQSILQLPSKAFKPPTCIGVRCGVGKCVGTEMICDGISDCPDNLDEKRCERHYLGLRASWEDDESKNNSSGPCPLGHFQCKSTNNCVHVGSFCDSVHDCGEDDFTDEPLDEEECNCREYLRMIAPHKICDSTGTIDCQDRSDQTDCPCHPGMFSCAEIDEDHQQLNNCFSSTFVCDGITDCKNGQDESNCITLSTSLVNLMSSRSEKIREKNLQEGYVLTRFHGTWHPYCSKDWSREMGSKLCTHLFQGSSFVSIKTLFLNEVIQKFYPDTHLLVTLKEPNINGSFLRLVSVEDFSSNEETDSDWRECRIACISCRLI